MAIPITPAKVMTLDKDKDKVRGKEKATDGVTVADRPMPQSEVRPKARTTKRQELDAAQTQ